MKILRYILAGFLLLLSGLGLTIWFFQVPDKPVEELAKVWAKPPSSFVPVNGMQIHVRDEGPRNNLTPIVLLHGTSASLHTWQGWADKLSASRRVIRFDMPAFGLTGPAPDNDYRIESYAKTVVAVMSKLNVERAVVAGNSLGGYVAWATAVLYPQHVDKLILVNASGFPYASESVPLGFKIASSPLLKNLVGDALPRAVIRSSLENVYSDTNKVTEALVDQYFNLTTRQGNRDALAQRFVQTMPGKLAKRVSEIQQPTLIIWGRDDKLIPLTLGRRFDSEISNSRLVVLDNLGHLPHEEGPEQTAKIVIEFLTRSLD